MRLYQRTYDDQINACNRCLFEARNSRVKTALDRFADLAEEGCGDAQTKAEMIYVEGVIRRDFLGQGLAARDLFEKVYSADEGHVYAVINATELARDRLEFDKWCLIFSKVVPSSETLSHESHALRCHHFDKGNDYWMILHDLSLTLRERGQLGRAASLMELALVDHRLPPGQEPQKRRWRAQVLRAIDEQADIFRTTNGEYFPPDERLSLQEALRELDRGIALDPYEAEMWNLRAAWSQTLYRFQEAEKAANKAIELRPYGYAKPHINKARALFGQGRRDEALRSAQEGLRQAQEAGDMADAQHVEELIEFLKRPEQSPSLSDLRPVFERIINSAVRLAEDELNERRQTDFATLGFFNRCRKIQGSAGGRFVPIVAEILSDFSPERAFQILSNIPKIPSQLLTVPLTLAQETYDNCLHAVLYVAAHSEGVRQSDAARLLCLIMFGALKAELIRKAYRQAILAPSAAANDAMSQLDAIMREELGRIHPDLPHLIADQEPISGQEQEKARKLILSRFGPVRKGSRVIISVCVLAALVAASIVFYCWYS